MIIICTLQDPFILEHDDSGPCWTSHLWSQAILAAITPGNRIL
jgi:hypothetical protein